MMHVRATEVFVDFRQLVRKQMNIY